MTPASLPALSGPEREHSHALEMLLRERIAAAGGFLSFAQFMELALYAPGLGYYSAGAAKFGRSGDFLTAPEASDLFSRCVAEQCAQVLAGEGVEGGEILELGAGTGRMAAVMLEQLVKLDALPRRYSILEVSAELAARQRERIAQLPAPLAARVRWLESWPEEKVRGVVLANEVLDALPFERFVMRGGAPHALGVGTDAGGALVLAEQPAGPALRTACDRLMSELGAVLPEGYSSEICLNLAPFVASLAAQLGEGIVLLFDYGLPRAHYYHPERSGGTLRCHFRHRAHDDALAHPGLQDITAWVDFTSVAEAAHASGLAVLGFATQAAFLLGTGIERQLARSRDATEHARLAGEARQLLLPGEMGEAFKVMALGREAMRGRETMPLAGFVHQDLRRQL